MTSRYVRHTIGFLLALGVSATSQAASVSVSVDTSVWVDDNVGSRNLSDEIPVAEMRTEGDLRLNDTSSVADAAAWAGGSLATGALRSRASAIMRPPGGLNDSFGRAVVAFSDVLTFTVPAGTYDTALEVTLTGNIAGTLSTVVNVSEITYARADFFAALTALDTVAFSWLDSDGASFDEDFQITSTLVPAETTILDTIEVALGFRAELTTESRASEVLSVGSASADFYNTSAARFLSLDVPEGVTWVSESGQFLMPIPVLAAVLPTSRSVRVGDTATAFATIINAGSATATDCGIAPRTNVEADFSYQTTDADNALIGTPNTPVDIAVGASQSYVFAFTPTASFDPIDVQLDFGCINTDPAPVTVGLNTLLLVADSDPVPDIVALGATLRGDGIVHLSNASNTGAFAVATVNVGVSDTITVSADTGGASVPVNIALCETDPGTGECINPTVPTLGPVITSIAGDATPTFSVFVTGTDTVPFDPANSRIFLRFADDGGVTRGATSVAVRTCAVTEC